MSLAFHLIESIAPTPRNLMTGTRPSPIYASRIGLPDTGLRTNSMDVYTGVAAEDEPPEETHCSGGVSAQE